MYKIKSFISHWLTWTYNIRFQLFPLATLNISQKSQTLEENRHYFIDLPIMKLLYTSREELANFTYFSFFFLGCVLSRTRFDINFSVSQIANGRCGNIFFFSKRLANGIVKTWQNARRLTCKELVSSPQQATHPC